MRKLSITGVLMRKARRSPQREESHGTTEAELRIVCPKPRSTGCPQKLEEMRHGFSPGDSGRARVCDSVILDSGQQNCENSFLS